MYLLFYVIYYFFVMYQISWDIECGPNEWKWKKLGFIIFTVSSVNIFKKFTQHYQ